MGFRQEDGRPDPERLLSRVQASGPPRGKLKIFLGYAAGVGKTYAMLAAARRKLAAGRDVRVGLVETHGRPETVAQLEGLPRLPTLRLLHNGLEVDEFDLDACLRERPELTLVDELAHSNAEGCRHAKRYQDVEELLDAGLDVYTTLNVQHLESLNDAVLQITNVRVRETVPNSMLDRADAVSLIDLPPEELLERLKAGHVYRPEKAERAAQNFFRPGNLTALREVALRCAAERVDDDVNGYMQKRAIEGPWQVTQRLLVAVGPSPTSAPLVRATRRLAESLSAEWWAVSVRSGALSPAAEASVTAHLELAESLGARTEVISGPSMPAAVMRFAREHNVTKVVAGKPGRARLPWQPDLIDGLLERSGAIDLLVVSTEDSVVAPVIPAEAPADHGWSYLKAVLLTALVSLVCFWLTPPLSDANVTTVYLLGVSVTAYLWGRRPAMLSSALSVVAYDFCFVPPVGTLTIADPQYLVTFAGLLCVALSISHLTARAREQAAAARAREQETASLFSLSRNLNRAQGEEEIGSALCAWASAQLGLHVLFVSAEPAEWATDLPDPTVRAVVTWAMSNGVPAGRGTSTLSQAPTLCVPLRRDGGPALGGLVLQLEAPLGASQRRLLDTMVAQGALALERERLASKAQEADLARSNERIGTALLNSVSHDLRIPLVSISGALDDLADASTRLTEAERLALLVNAREEADRLNRIVANLLSITRLEGGQLQSHPEPQELDEIIHLTLGGLGNPARVQLQLQDNLPLVRADFVLLQQVLSNLIDNALKFSEPGSDSPVEVGTTTANGQPELWVRDWGRGLPPGDPEALFERFYRADPGVPGSGLGLSVCRGLLASMGATIEAQAAHPGARFVVRLEEALQPSLA